MESITTVEDTKTRVEKLQRYVNKVESALKAISQEAQNNSFESFSEDDVRFHLSHDPNMIADAGLFLAEIQRRYEYAKTDTQTILAEIWNECNQRREELGLSNAKDRECWVKTQPRYVEAQKQEIEWKYNLNRMQVIYDRYENMFTGVRKIANLLEKDNENVYRRERYE